MSDNLTLVLNEGERNSSAWLKIRAHLEARIDLHRRTNDNEQTPDKTALLRGRLAELKHLLAAGETQDQHQ